MPIISVKDKICDAYYPIFFTNCENIRYRCMKGGRSTGKSFNILGIEPIIIILSSKLKNIIMFRANDVDNSDSTYAQLVQCINYLGVSHLFKCTTSPYKITRKATGQVILFRGAANNPTSITSIKPQVGYFSNFYFEEASELPSYEDFSKIDGSLRIGTKEIEMCKAAGEKPQLLITFACNAWDVGHWLNDKFFKDRLDDNPDELEKQGYMIYKNYDFNLGFGKGLILHTSTYKANNFMPQEQKEAMELLKNIAYDQFKVLGLGCWGNTSEGCYPDWKDDLILDTFKINTLAVGDFAVGVDVGISDGQGRVLKQDGEVKSATTMALVALTQDNEKLVVMDEFFHTNIGLKVPKTEPEIQHMMCEKLKTWFNRFKWMSIKRCRVFVDSASPGFMQTLRDMAHNYYGLFNCVFEPSTKIKIHNRINFTNYLMAFKEFLVGITCTNLIREIKQAHKGPKGEPRGTNDHEIDAMEYAATMLWGKLRRAKGYKFTDGENKKLNIE